MPFASEDTFAPAATKAVLISSTRSNIEKFNAGKTLIEYVFALFRLTAISKCKNSNFQKENKKIKRIGPPRALRRTEKN